MKKATIAILILLVIAGTAFGAYKLGTKQANKQTVSPVSISPTVTPTVKPENVAEKIQLILANKYNKPVNEVNVTIAEQNSQYAGGSVLFGQGGPGEAGMFLARKVGNVWEVVFDGNGNADCNKMRQVYGFPDDILKPNFCE